MTENERLTNSNKEIPTLEHNEGFWLKVYFKLKGYEAIGTIEEFKALKEKNVAKKVVSRGQGHEADCYCPNCNAFLGNDQDFCFSHTNYCNECGQALED